MVDIQQDNPTDSIMNQNQSDPKPDTTENESQNQSDQNPDSTENESQNLIEKENDDDEFIRITAAHQTLIEGNEKMEFLKKNSFHLAQTYEEQKNYPLALHLYRICVDFLLEELMFAESTEQSRIYLREKCTAVMDRIDLLKTKLEPLPLSIPTEESITNPPIDQLESINLS